MTPSTGTNDQADIEATVAHQRKIQREQDERDAAKARTDHNKQPAKEGQQALQAGTTAYPVPPQRAASG